MFLHCVHFSLLRFELYFWARASLETKSRQIKQQLRCRFYGATVQQQSFFSSSSSSFSIAQCSDRVLFSFLYPTAHIHCSLHCSLPTLWHLCKKKANTLLISPHNRYIIIIAVIADNLHHLFCFYFPKHFESCKFCLFIRWIFKLKIDCVLDAFCHFLVDCKSELSHQVSPFSPLPLLLLAIALFVCVNDNRLSGEKKCEPNPCDLCVYLCLQPYTEWLSHWLCYTFFMIHRLELC